MKRLFFVLIAVFVSATYIQGQEKETEPVKKENRFKSAWKKGSADVSELWKSMNRQTENTDLVKVKGLYYMPLYTVNLYSGKDVNQLASLCRRQFRERYPLAEIQTIAIPQTDWLHNMVEKDGVFMGYTHLLYLYIVALDGGDSMINARFVFKRYEERTGGSVQELPESYPNWERTDHITPEVYEILARK